MNGLPGGLADPLHLSYPVPWTALMIFGLLLLFGILLALLLAWVRRPSTPPPVPQPAAPARGVGIADAIEELRRRHGTSSSFRVGCHELALLLRRHFEQASGHEYSTWTAGEMRRHVGDTALSRFFGFLADLQFGRRRPNQNDFDGACDLALDVARGTTGR